MFANPVITIPGWGTDMGITWGGTDPAIETRGTTTTTDDTDMYGFHGWLPSWAVPTTEEVLTPIAQTTFDVLDPAFGSGGMFEPVTVWVDPDRTIKEEYIDPALEEYGTEMGLVLIGLVAVASILK